MATGPIDMRRSADYRRARESKHALSVERSRSAHPRRVETQRGRKHAQRPGRGDDPLIDASPADQLVHLLDRYNESSFGATWTRDVLAALYVGDDVTDLDAFRGLDELVEKGRLGRAVKIGVRSDEGPAQLTDEADWMVEGTDGVRELLRALLG